MIKRLSAAMVAACLLSSPAWAQHTKAQLATDISTCFPDNTTGAITPATVRTCMTTLMNSWQQYASVNAQTGASYTVALSDYGQLVTFNNSGAVAVTLPQATSSFAAFNFFATNLGAGTVTITPTTSTINGASSLALSQGQSVWVVSDGTNYQIFSNVAQNIPSGDVIYTPSGGSTRTLTSILFEGSSSSIVNWGGKCNASQDNTSAYNSAYTAVTSGTFGTGVPYLITFPQGTCNFNSKPNNDTLGINIIGVNKSQAAAVRNYNEATATNGLFHKTFGSSNVSNGCRIENMSINAGNATTGGSGVALIGTSSANGPDFCTFTNLTVSYTGTGAYSASGATLYIDGSAITTGAIGIRDTKLTNVELFSNGWPAAVLKSVVDFDWNGGNIAGLSTDTLSITGTAGVPSTNVNINVDNMDAISIDHTNECHIRANQILGAVTIDSTAVSCYVESDTAVGGTVTNNSTTSCVRSGGTWIGSACFAIQSTSVTAFAVGANGSSNPAFSVDASTGSQVAGLNVKGAVTGGTVAVAAIDSGSNTNLTINAKGTGTIGIGSVSTGAVTITPATTFTNTPTLSSHALNSSTALQLLNGGSGQELDALKLCTDATYSNCSTTPTNGLQIAGNSVFKGSALSTSASGGIGYSTGAGCAVTQGSSRTTGVSCTGTTGAITLVSAAGSTSFNTFTVTDTSVAATDTVLVSQKSGTDKYEIFTTAVTGGTFNITFATTGGTTTEQPVFNFVVIKGSAS